jgi:hypothetical protein
MAPEERTEPPLGTVTFVLADVEPESAVERPERIIDAAVATHRGTRLDRLGQGAGAVAVFESAADAVAAAHQIQLTLTGDARTEPSGHGCGWGSTPGRPRPASTRTTAGRRSAAALAYAMSRTADRRCCRR